MLEQLWISTSDGVARATRPDDRTLRGHAVRALTHDPGHRRWWAIVDGRTIVRADGDAPTAWREVAQFSDLRAHCLLPAGDVVLVGTSDARLFALDPRSGELEPVESFDHVPGRMRWYTPWGAPADVRSLAVTPAGAWLVNVHVGGVARSRDRGRTWDQTMDIEADAHQVIAGPDGALAATASGLAVSGNGGGSWRFLHEGLPFTYMRGVAVAERHIVVSVSRGDGGQDAGLFRLEASGAMAADTPFERCREGLPRAFDDNVNTGSLVARGAFVAAATPGGEVYVSEDDGGTWRRAVEGLPPTKGLALG